MKRPGLSQNLRVVALVHEPQCGIDDELDVERVDEAVFVQVAVVARRNS